MPCATELLKFDRMLRTFAGRRGIDRLRSSRSGQHQCKRKRYRKEIGDGQYGEPYAGRHAGQTTSARLVVEILEAAASGDLAAELSMDYELTVNLKTAKDLGVTIPPTLLVAATKVIE